MDSSVAQLLPEAIANAYSEQSPQFRARVPLEAVQTLLQAKLGEAQTAVATISEIAMATVRRTMAEKFEELIGILCLTEDPMSLLMWAHYADCHRGFVVEFDSETHFFNQRKSAVDDLRHIRRVVYQKDRPSHFVMDLDALGVFLTKGEEWSYEREWRIIRPLEDASHVISGHPASVHLFEFPKSIVQRVILGCRMIPSKKSEIQQILNDSEYQHVPCEEAQIHENRYQLVFARSLRR